MGVTVKVPEKTVVPTVEVPEKIVVPKAEPLTEQDAKEMGLDSREIELGKKQGVIAEVKKEEVEKEELKKLEELKKPEEPKPDMIDRIKKGEEISAEEEHEELGKLDRKGQAYYFQMKNERKKRQDAVNERDLLKIQLESSKKELASLEKLKAEPAKKPEDDLNLLEEAERYDEDGNIIKKEKPEAKFVTVADLENREKEKAERLQVEAKERNEMMNRIVAQEKEVKAKDPGNYGYMINLATEVMEKDKTGVIAYRFFMKAINPEPEEDGINAVDFAYQLAKLHPDYKADGGKEKKEGEKKLDIEKVIEHAARRSSAGIGSGGNRIISEDDLTPEDVAKLSQVEYNKLAQSTRERILREIG